MDRDGNVITTVVMPQVVISAAGYTTAPVDCGFPTPEDVVAAPSEVETPVRSSNGHTDRVTAPAKTRPARTSRATLLVR